MNKVFMCLLVALPLTWAADHFHWSPMVIMLFSCLGIIPIAKLMGEATEHLAHKTNPTVGGLLSASFGNACELIIAFMALKAGLVEVVKASITGSIIGNLLLVFGASMIAGGLKRDEQSFNKVAAGTASTMLTITAMALLVPSAIHHTGGDGQLIDGKIALAISLVLIGLYAALLFFNLKTHRHLLQPVSDGSHDGHDAAGGWSLGKSVLVLLGSTLAVFFLAEHLVENVEHVAKDLGMTPIFVGVILLAIIGNAAENSSAIVMAHKNKMDLSLSIVTGSSTQIAMFVAPVLVIAGAVIGQPMDLVFTQAEVIAVVSSVMILNLIVHDGKSNWLEGVGLLAFYAILGICFYFV